MSLPNRAETQAHGVSQQPIDLRAHQIELELEAFPEPLLLHAVHRGALYYP